MIRQTRSFGRRPRLPNALNQRDYFTAKFACLQVRMRTIRLPGDRGQLDEIQMT
jgi:hypothetical protein